MAHHSHQQVLRKLPASSSSLCCACSHLYLEPLLPPLNNLSVFKAHSVITSPVNCLDFLADSVSLFYYPKAVQRCFHTTCISVPPQTWAPPRCIDISISLILGNQCMLDEWITDKTPQKNKQFLFSQDKGMVVDGMQGQNHQKTFTSGKEKQLLSIESLSCNYWYLSATHILALYPCTK